MKRSVLSSGSVLMLAAALAFAQGPPAQPQGPPQQQGPPQAGGPGGGQQPRPARVPPELLAGSYWQVMALPRADAAAVVRTLEQQGFPTRLGPANENLTRVLVGPFRDTQSMGRAKAQLESAGFHPVRAGRAPENPPPPPAARRPPLERALGAGPGRWWDNPDMVQKLSLTTDQVKRMDDILQQNRLKLIDLNASVQKEELIMEPLVAADQPDESKILAQIDKVAQARAELEKANARFLLGIRRVLNGDQWKKLEEADQLKRWQEERPRAAAPARARK